MVKNKKNNFKNYKFYEEAKEEFRKAFVEFQAFTETKLSKFDLDHTEEANKCISEFLSGLGFGKYNETYILAMSAAMFDIVEEKNLKKRTCDIMLEFVAMIMMDYAEENEVSEEFLDTLALAAEAATLAAYTNIMRGIGGK